MMILCSNPKAQYNSSKKAISDIIKETLDSGWYILGQKVSNFEEAFAEYNGVKYALGVGNGTDAIYIALKSCGIGAGDEVITVSHTALATVAAIIQSGAKPVLVDINPKTYTINTRLVENHITSKTKAILPVHLYGHPANVTELKSIAKKYGLFLIEDCAQAHGATVENKKVGSIGDIGCFSFYPSKNLGALGDGGAVITNNKKIAEKIKQIRQYGWSKNNLSNGVGINSRLDELQAAILLIKLNRLDEDNNMRKKIAGYYRDNLSNTKCEIPEKADGVEHVYHQFVIKHPKRNQLKKYLESKKIFPLIHYPVPVHKQKGYRDLVKVKYLLKETETAAKKILSLPIYPELSKKEQNKIIKKIKEFESIS